MFDLTHQELKNVLLGVQLQRSAHIAEKDRFNLATTFVVFSKLNSLHRIEINKIEFTFSHE